jgi:radical SAM superfamily enzyme YgiQ (UPF0313 family)
MLKISIVQQAAWDVPVDTMPLAAGYLKAVLDADPDLHGEVDARICNFRGGTTLYQMAQRLFSGDVPDVLAFSVLGWNYRKFACVAETFKHLRPDGVVVFGGVHVSGQAERVFREHPAVDVVINGEGEVTLPELVKHLLAEPTAELDPAGVAGLTYRRPDGSAHTTAERPRIEDLDTIPSPFLTGAIPMTDHTGAFRYDVVIMETNRGCPYKCSFCFWGGAVGQRVRSFSRDRLAAELDLFGHLKVPTICLCDANFGLLESDEEFVEDLIRTRQRHGYPRGLESSWAKNKSERFRRIVRQMKQHDFHSSFVLSLQTLSEDALTVMRRRNMKVNQWESLVEWLTEEGMDCVGEMIWGAPGETPESFLAGYDRLAEKVSRIAVYPLLLLPNTDYTENRAVHGFVTVRGEADDFEYVLGNRTASVPESMRIQRFLFWARLLSENHYLHHVWLPTRELAGMTQSEIILSLMSFVDAAPDPVAAEFRDLIPVIAESPAVIHALRRLYEDPAAEDLLRQWWRTEIVPRYPAAWQDFARALYDFEQCCRPRYVLPGAAPAAGWHIERQADEEFYVSAPIPFRYDVAAVLATDLHDPDQPPPAADCHYTFRARADFYHNADNHEIALGYKSTPTPASPEPAC